MSENYLTQYQLALCELLGLDYRSVESLEVRTGAMTGMKISAEFVITPTTSIVLHRNDDRALEVLRELYLSLQEHSLKRPIPVIDHRLFDAVNAAGRLIGEIVDG